MAKVLNHRCNALLLMAGCVSLISIFTFYPNLNYKVLYGDIVPTNSTEEIETQLEHSRPLNLSYCLNLRVPGIIETLNLEDNLHLLKPFTQNGKRKLRVGIGIFEDNTGFWGLNGDGVFHLYHFIEFLLYAYTALMQIANTVTPSPNEEGGGMLSLAESIVEVPWLYAPYLARNELQGSHHINEIVAGLVLRQTPHIGAIKMKGLEDNDDFTQAIHPSFKGKEKQNFVRQIRRRFRLPDARVRHQNWRNMTDAADVVVFISRVNCDHGGLGQMPAKLPDMGYFPAQAWSNDIAAGLLTGRESHTIIPKDKFVACYIDRQRSSRKMPKKEHEWLVKTLSDHPDVYFQHLHMEKYSALEQLKIAHTCDLMVGVHGNGLTHQLWMKRGGYLVEYFWDNDFVWCYTIMALLMQHDLLIFWRGKPVDSQRLQNRDVHLQGELNSNKRSKWETETVRQSFTEFLGKAVTKFKRQKQAVQNDWRDL